MFMGKKIKNKYYDFVKKCTGCFEFLIINFDSNLNTGLEN
jgi:hypothetical protein